MSSTIAVLNGKYILIDKNGKFLSKEYDYADEGFSCSCIRVRLDNKWGFIDENGKEIIPLKYDDAEMFHNCRASVTLDGKKFDINR